MSAERAHEVVLGTRRHVPAPLPPPAIALPPVTGELVYRFSAPPNEVPRRSRGMKRKPLPANAPWLLCAFNVRPILQLPVAELGLNPSAKKPRLWWRRYSDTRRTEAERSAEKLRAFGLRVRLNQVLEAPQRNKVKRRGSTPGKPPFRLRKRRAT